MSSASQPKSGVVAADTSAEQEWGQCRACGGTNGHWEGCKGEAALEIELASLRAALAQSEQRRDEAIEAKKFTQQWYAVRWERLKDWARNEIPADLREQFFCIVANATKSVLEPPTYGLQLNMMRHRAELAEERAAQSEQEQEKLRRKAAHWDEITEWGRTPPDHGLAWFLKAKEIQQKLQQSEQEKEKLRELLSVARCPNCENEGWYVVPNRNTGEPEQQQCEFCHEREGLLKPDNHAAGQQKEGAQ